ncbi:PFL_4669 family integrating conjugative element protein [Ralstonia sp.]|uniref:PFL_4669 family integrating conjugative element protein n=1 Tax=Ralstonia sp. TaxID=54061 RepID=UPI0031E007D3
MTPIASAPFPDGYDIERERLALQDMLDGDTDPHDPRQSRLRELLHREEELRQRQVGAERRNQAGPLVRDREAQAMRNMGALRAVQADVMHLHTRDAYRLFLGRAADARAGVAPIYGARLCAYALRMLWTQSLHDNPFADWALITIDGEIDQVKTSLRQYVDELVAKLDALRSRGLEISILAAAQTQRTELTFSSPYAYAIVNLILDFDYAVRLARTLGRRAAMSDQEVDAAIRAVRTPLRRLITRIVQFNTVLHNEAVRHCTRADFLPQSDATAKRRISMLTQVYGDLPGAVLSGVQRPRHGQRLTHPSGPRATMGNTAAVLTPEETSVGSTLL